MRLGALRLVPLTLLATTMSCGDSVSVSNSSPTGSVGGVIVDATTRVPVASASVVLLAGGKRFNAVETKPDGSFSFNGVPAGNVLVQVTPPAMSPYWGADIARTLDGSAGMFPVGNEAITLEAGLVPATNAFKFRVVDHLGAPVANYDVGFATSFQWVDFSYGYPNQEGAQNFALKTDVDGFATVPNIPDYWGLGQSVNDAVFITLPPLDADGDGVYEFAGGTKIFNMRSLADPTPDVVLTPNFANTLYVEASTIHALVGGGFGSVVQPAVIMPSDPIYVKFNLPIENQVVEVTAVDENGNAVTPPPSTTVTDDTLKISFSSLLVGAEYNVSIHVVTSVGNVSLEGDFAAPFFTENPAATVTAMAMRLPSGNIRITFSEPVGTGSPGTNFLSGGQCVLFFNFDLDSSGLPIGNTPGELGNPDCEGGRPFYSVEVDPVGPVGQSGYSSVWEFPPPLPMGMPLPGGTPLHIFFSHVVDPHYRIERPDGRPVADFTGSTAIFL